MEMGVSQSIFNQKNTTGSTGIGYLSTTTWAIFWNNFQISLDVETIFTLLGFQVSSLVFLSISPATTGYISVTNTWLNNTP